MELNIFKLIKLKIDSRVIKKSLYNICTPASEEIGLILRDKIRTHRLNNLFKVNQFFRSEYSVEHLNASPKCLIPIIEMASLEENETIQKMWAGLLASSCKPLADDDIFVYINLLKQLTISQAKLINHVCEKIPKKCIEGLYIGEDTQLTTIELSKIMEINDIERIDRELDCLRNIGIIEGGYPYGIKPEYANITMTPTGLTLFIRCKGNKSSIGDYFNINKVISKISTTH